MRVLQFVLAAIFTTAAAVYAQEPAAPPSHISFVDGSAVVLHANDESEPAVVNMPIVEGDRIRTMARSRVDVMFPDGASVAIEPDSEVEFLTTTRVRVLGGAIEHRAAPPLDPRSPSSQYLPPDLQPYGPDLDRSGAWQYEPQYGNVWYPTAVAADWRPYYDGYWDSYPAYGWTWIGYERWAWPTHHYGRWGYGRNRWFWIPGRSFAAAWVSWGTAPDYVSWCPLGYDNRPVLALSVGIRSSWNPWIIVRREHFGARGYSARRYAVEPYRIASTTAFIEHRTPPGRDRRGSFNVPGPGVGARSLPADRRPASGSAGVAVPRGDYRGSADYRRRVDATRGQQPPTVTAPRSPAVTVPSDAPRYRRSDNTPRTTNDQRGTTGDHPDYRPRYQPRYEDQRPQGPTYRDRRVTGGDTRAVAPERSEPRPAAEPRQQPRERAAERPRSDAAPPRGDRPSGPPAREPHAGRESRDRSSSGGTAVRRPR